MNRGKRTSQATPRSARQVALLLRAGKSALARVEPCCALSSFAFCEQRLGEIGNALNEVGLAADLLNFSHNCAADHCRIRKIDGKRAGRLWRDSNVTKGASYG